jgi:hypothetical protein
MPASAKQSASSVPVSISDEEPISGLVDDSTVPLGVTRVLDAWSHLRAWRGPLRQRRLMRVAVRATSTENGLLHAVSPCRIPRRRRPAVTNAIAADRRHHSPPPVTFTSARSARSLVIGRRSVFAWRPRLVRSTTARASRAEAMADRERLLLPLRCDWAPQRSGGAGVGRASEQAPEPLRASMTREEHRTLVPRLVLQDGDVVRDVRQVRDVSDPQPPNLVGTISGPAGPQLDLHDQHGRTVWDATDKLARCPAPLGLSARCGRTGRWSLTGRS